MSRILESVVSSVAFVEGYISCEALAMSLPRESWQRAYNAMHHLAEVEAELREAVKRLREREGVV
ncbi:MAG: hypothetical protein A2Z31_01225 [candidate division NC10 bacterium RBG_16_65_8]|nr:MAG: hypothetical protein A2Z31_01225 [candidate division NC10 bacterium RBG_16_65_8]